MDAIEQRIEQGKQVFEREATDRLVKIAKDLVENDRAAWVVDAVNEDVVALVLPGSHSALALVYVKDGDFEVDELVFDILERNPYSKERQ